MTIERGFIELAVEQWRLIRLLERLSERVPFESQSRVQAQARYAGSKLDAILLDADMTLERFEGRLFEPGLPVTSLNSDEVPNDRPLLVQETIEPAVLQNGRVLQLGKVTLREGNDDAFGN